MEGTQGVLTVSGLGGAIRASSRALATNATPRQGWTESAEFQRLRAHEQLPAWNSESESIPEITHFFRFLFFKWFFAFYTSYCTYKTLHTVTIRCISNTVEEAKSTPWTRESSYTCLFCAARRTYVKAATGFSADSGEWAVNPCCCSVRWWVSFYKWIRMINWANHHEKELIQGYSWFDSMWTRFHFLIFFCRIAKYCFTLICVWTAFI